MEVNKKHERYGIESCALESRSKQKLHPLAALESTRARPTAAGQSVTTDRKANNTNLQPRATFATSTHINNIRCAQMRAHTRRQLCLDVKYESTLPILCRKRKYFSHEISLFACQEINRKL